MTDPRDEREKFTVSPQPMFPKLRPKDDAALDSGPIVVLNLLKCYEDTEENMEQYIEYLANVMKGFGDVGMAPVYAGKMNELIYGGCGDWDYMLLVHYPNRRTWFDMMESEEYIAFSKGREDAMKMAVLWFSDPLIPYSTSDGPVGVPDGAWQKKIETLLAK